MSRACCLLIVLSILSTFDAFQRLSQFKLSKLPATCLFSNPKDESSLSKPVKVRRSPEEAKQKALETLEILTSPRDPKHPQYDKSKADHARELISSMTYSSLKVGLSRLGLDDAGDKEEMIIRLLLHTIDPTIKYEDLTADNSVKLQYISDMDFLRDETGEKVPVPIRSNASPLPTSDDFQYKAPANPAHGKNTSPRTVMDGVEREVVRVRNAALLTKDMHAYPAYLARARDVTGLWKKERASVIVLVPIAEEMDASDGDDSAGKKKKKKQKQSWQRRDMRILADEIAYETLSPVLLIPAPAPSLSHAALFDHVAGAVVYARTALGGKGVGLVGVGKGAAQVLEYVATAVAKGCEGVLEDGRVETEGLGIFRHLPRYVPEADQEDDNSGGGDSSSSTSNSSEEEVRQAFMKSLSAEEKEEFDREMRAILEDIEQTEEGRSSTGVSSSGEWKEVDTSTILPSLTSSISTNSSHSSVTSNIATPSPEDVQLAEMEGVRRGARVGAELAYLSSEHKPIPRSILPSLIPRAVVSLCPQNENADSSKGNSGLGKVRNAGSLLTPPLLMVLGDQNTQILKDSRFLHASLQGERGALDFMFRVYEGKQDGFAYIPFNEPWGDEDANRAMKAWEKSGLNAGRRSPNQAQEEEDRGLAQHILSLTTSFLDTYLPADNDLIGAAGISKKTQGGWVTLPASGKGRGVYESSPPATAHYLHDDEEYAVKGEEGL